MICKHTHRFVAQPDYVRHRTGSTILHDNPQVCVLEITAIVLHNIGATKQIPDTVVVKSFLQSKNNRSAAVASGTCKNKHLKRLDCRRIYETRTEITETISFFK